MWYIGVSLHACAQVCHGVTGDDLHAMLMQMKESSENYTW